MMPHLLHFNNKGAITCGVYKIKHFIAKRLNYVQFGGINFDNQFCNLCFIMRFQRVKKR